MSHVIPEMRRIMVMAKKTGKKTKEVAEFPRVSRQIINVLKSRKGPIRIKRKKQYASIIIDDQKRYGPFSEKHHLKDGARKKA